MFKRITDTKPEILDIVKQHGFATFENGDYNLNIIGVRNLSSRRAGLFDDRIHIVFKKGGVWNDWSAPLTTDPGRYYLEKTDYRDDGVAILVHPQQCRGAYKIGPHGKARTPSLRQHLPVMVWRDNNHDSILDYGSEIDTGVFFINIHRASTSPDGTKNVSSWSAGCQVFQHKSDFDVFMDLCYKSVQKYGDSITYTLIGI